MANDISLLEQTITTVQTFPGPNKSLAGTKNVLCALDIEVQGEQAFVPGHYKLLDLAGYLDLEAIADVDYAGSFLDKAAIGSSYRQLTVVAGVVTATELFYKDRNGTNTNVDWDKVTKAAVT